MDVLCFGTSCMDVTVGIIEQDGFFEKEFNDVSSVEYTPGGDALNEAKILAKLGFESAYIGRVSDDIIGRGIIDDLKNAGVCTDHIKLTSDPTCSVIKLVGRNDRRNFIIPRNGTTLQMLSAEDFDLSLISHAKILTVGSLFVHPLLTADALEPVLTKAKEAGVTVCADMGLNDRVSMAYLEGVWDKIDYFFPNLEEAQALTGENDYHVIAEKLLEKGVKNIIIKLGGEGSYFRNAQTEILQPIIPAEKVLDTTGAGDTYMGGFLAGLLKGYDISRCMELGAACSSLTIQVFGASTAISSMAQVEEYLKNYKEVGVK